jgi:ABC-type Fe3+-hydroxamate transport system, periplasmic component
MNAKRLLALSLCMLLLVAFLGGCGTAESDDSDPIPAEYPLAAFGTTVLSRPGRVVSLSPALTEKLYDLNLQDRLVGVSDYCDYPAEIADLSRCGIAQAPKLNTIIELNAHIVLTETALSEDALITLQQKQIDVLVVPRAQTLEQLLANYHDLSRVFDGDLSGAELGTAFTAKIRYALEQLQTAARPANIGASVLYLRMMDFTVATGDTLENDLLELLGVDNIAAQYTDWLYPSSTAEGDGRKDFEALAHYFMDEKYVNIHHLEQSAFYKGLQATLKDYYLYIDMDLFERQSLRMFPELWRMAAYLYPDAAIPSWEAAFTAPPVPAEPAEQETPTENNETDLEADA